jgi:1-acyl-sn-glycerol-3-phosphate acyltransferase
VSSGRDELVGAIIDFLSIEDPAARAQIRGVLEREIDGAGRAALVNLWRALGERTEWDYFPSDPVARRIHHVLARILMHPASTLGGMEHVAAVAGRAAVILPNHLSYADANVVELLLDRCGAEELAGRLTIIAGPKVFVDLQRRFSSLCFGTVRTPQSSGRSSEEAVMTPREVARAASVSIAAAHDRLAKGDALLVFGEGTRSRTSTMQPMLPGVARYFEGRDALLLPIGIVGTDAAFPVGENRLHRVPLVARVGPPVEASALWESAGRVRRLAMDAMGLAIAEQLPPEYRGVYAEDTADLEAAREVLARARNA